MVNDRRRDGHYPLWTSVQNTEKNITLFNKKVFVQNLFLPVNIKLWALRILNLRRHRTSDECSSSAYEPKAPLKEKIEKMNFAAPCSCV